jgi:AcrR family transcriptional regulator
MPKLWTAAIESHRREVHDAILDAAGALVAEDGLLAVSMSEVAKRSGVARATLYRYFPDVDAVLLAWHARELETHLDGLRAVRNDVEDVGERLGALLEAYANGLHASHGHRDTALGALLHSDVRVAGAEQTVHGLLEDVIADAAAAGLVRRDVPANELASYCLSALSAAGTISARAAVRRLVAVTLAGLGVSAPAARCARRETR